MPPDSVSIELWRPDAAHLPDDLAMLGDVLHSCVHAGASVSFILPFSSADARSFWSEKILPSVYAGTCRVLIARSSGQIVGTVQLDLATPPNQPHRVDVKKLLVHPDARGGGIARTLMLAVEEQARAAGRTLLTLDTANDHAEALYLSLGYIRAGFIPGYSRRPDSPELEATVILYKVL